MIACSYFTKLMVSVYQKTQLSMSHFVSSVSPFLDTIQLHQFSPMLRAIRKVDFVCSIKYTKCRIRFTIDIISRETIRKGFPLKNSNLDELTITDAVR